MKIWVEVTDRTTYETEKKEFPTFEEAITEATHIKSLRLNTASVKVLKQEHEDSFLITSQSINHE